MANFNTGANIRYNETKNLSMKIGITLMLNIFLTGYVQVKFPDYGNKQDAPQKTSSKKILSQSKNNNKLNYKYVISN